MNVAVAPHPWSRDALFAKALRYAETMLAQGRDEWTFGFWSSLLLEHLSRAALANVSPTLLADGKEWNNIYYSLGHSPTANKFQPGSASTKDVLTRLQTVVPTFTREHFSFCLDHASRRNAEVHSGDCPYDAIGTSSWLPKFFAASKVLLTSLGLGLEDLFGKDEASAAEVMISSLNDQAAAAVKGTISSHATVWQSKSQQEQQQLHAQALVWATRVAGHRVGCPACRANALLFGSPQAAPKKHLDGDTIVERQPMLPSSFQCVACGLQILGYSKLNACGLGDIFTATMQYDAADLVQNEDEYDGPEPDYNEDDAF